MDFWDRGEGARCWSPSFLRPLNDWEIEEMVRFLQTLHNQNFYPTGEDKLLLKDVEEKGFSVKIMYKGFDISPAFDFPYRLFGIQLFPQKLESLLGKLFRVKCSRWINLNAVE